MTPGGQRPLVFLTATVLFGGWLSTAHAAKVFHITEPVLDQVMNPCAPAELVTFSGTRSLTLHLTENKNSFHLHGQTSYQGVSGSGLTSGDDYRVVSVDGFRLSGAKGVTQTVNTRMRLIRQGHAENMMVDALMHVTVNAQGVVTTVTDTFTIDCR